MALYRRVQTSFWQDPFVNIYILNSHWATQVGVPMRGLRENRKPPLGMGVFSMVAFPLSQNVVQFSYAIRSPYSEDAPSTMGNSITKSQSIFRIRLRCSLHFITCRASDCDSNWVSQHRSKPTISGNTANTTGTALWVAS